ncbi:MAG: protein phosphatase 2C domain-containing protein [Pseudomonadota bacterium]
MRGGNPPIGWVSAAARCRGTAHATRGEACEDALRVSVLGPDQSHLIAVVADGAGSAARGGAGAALACRTLSSLAGAMLSQNRLADLGIADLRTVAITASDRMEAVAARHGLSARDLATTALLALSDGTRSLILHVGDGAIVGRCGETGAWSALSWPAHGPYAGTTAFLTDEGEDGIRTLVDERPLDAVCLFSDGLERLVLDFASGEPHPPFFRMVAAPLDALAADPEAARGRNPRLSHALRRYLESDGVAERGDDDKTLVVAVRATSRLEGDP